ncbi:MAG: bifunctional diaminohydroxyphosphoribosylaminopyrimidine deaminase/5-amino-6-(5-phosphoribosylamino)uracil reductase RibD [Enterobacteriaceae bacterium]|nr:bifunctional diaminohydroxyphosphoribosylaminopyrimidine deaminase/5-amino-6-(5-phosphoribosylamino)uracil reductase RibD [Enterobacteriaceae bacterium]
MKAALYESMKALPTCLPNPPVGAVITHNNIIIGKGFTQEYGGKHAEIMAIENAKEITLLNECNIYITLEPCCFYGKTPPCVDSIIKYNFKKVFVGMIDSHSKNNGNGVDKLRAKNIDTCVGLLKEEIENFLLKYLWSN